MADMPICEIAVKCTHCKEYFDSGLFMGSLETYNSTVIMDCIQTCPLCKKPTPLNKNTMSYIGTKTE